MLPYFSEFGPSIQSISICSLLCPIQCAGSWRRTSASISLICTFVSSVLARRIRSFLPCPPWLTSCLTIPSLLSPMCSCLCSSRAPRSGRSNIKNLESHYDELSMVACGVYLGSVVENYVISLMGIKSSKRNYALTPCTTPWTIRSDLDRQFERHSNHTTSEIRRIESGNQRVHAVSESRDHLSGVTQSPSSSSRTPQSSYADFCEPARTRPIIETVREETCRERVNFKLPLIIKNQASGKQQSERGICVSVDSSCQVAAVVVAVVVEVADSGLEKSKYLEPSASYCAIKQRKKG